MTPQRSTTVLSPNAAAYSVISSSAASFVAPYERPGPVEWKALGDAPFRHAVERLLGLQLEARVLLPVVERVLLFDRIDPARRQEHELRAASSGELEAVVSPEQVRPDEVVGT